MTALVNLVQANLDQRKTRKEDPWRNVKTPPEGTQHD
jgi:hypothetical protein